MLSYRQVGVKDGKIFTINEKGFIGQKNLKYITTYYNLNETMQLIFPVLKSNNTFIYSDVNYFKPKLDTKINVNDLFK